MSFLFDAYELGLNEETLKEYYNNNHLYILYNTNDSRKCSFELPTEKILI